jgi:3-hydroxyisobutyrate dehydrogenase-like beta-hydroxyacid dehydrogenase
MSPAEPSLGQDLKIGFLGFGEASQAIVGGWHNEKLCEKYPTISAFDIKTNEASSAPLMLETYSKTKISGEVSLRAVMEKAQVIFSLVTADQALIVAQQSASFISSGSYYLDCNSCSPDKKRAASDVILAAGGVYVDVAIMSPIHPLKHQSPMLLSGKNSVEACAILQSLGMNPTDIGGKIGDASSTKMIRSVMVKGLEALMAECALAGQKAGVSERVIASLEQSYPGFGWQKRCSYAFERMMVHGKRRAEEMREVALTVESLGLESAMSTAIVRWQETIGNLGLVPASDDFQSRADTILAAIQRRAFTQAAAGDNKQSDLSEG